LKKNKFLKCTAEMIVNAIASALLIIIIMVPFKSSYASVLERQTTEGIVIGVENKDNQTISWKGIPYARPPVANLRWKSPQKPIKRTQALKADTFCQICPQYAKLDTAPDTPQVISGREDCLYLNIWAPKKAKNLPVFFWIHGGGNSIQFPLFSNQDCSILANHGNMVIVGINFRIGPMGFLHHSALKTGDKESDSGNFTILDQIEALKWVQANIKNFGGDPDNVTLAGVSSGGQDALCLVGSPLAKGLFHRVISQSGSIRPSTPEDGEAHANEILSRMMVNDGSTSDKTKAARILANMSLKEIEAYMRSKKAADFLEAYPEGAVRGMIQFPTAFEDGHVLPKDFYGALSSGTYNKVPMILGSNKEETRVFARNFNSFSNSIKDGSLFKEPEKMQLFDKVIKYQSDLWKVMAVDEPARVMTSMENQPPIYTYQFLWGAGGTNGTVLTKPLNILLGACHIAEIDFVFGTDKASLGSYLFNEKNRAGRVALSNAMMTYWSQFAKTGNPNPRNSDLPAWLAWSNNDGPKTLLLDAGLQTAKIAMSETELTWNKLKNDVKAEPLQPKIQPFLDKWNDFLFRNHEKQQQKWLW